jgi:hypothetical protein
MEEIFGAYGVPLTFVLADQVSRDNFRASVQQWMQFTINPKLTMIEQKLNEQFTPNWGDGLFLLFDSPIPVDDEARLKEIETLLRTKYSFVNEQRAKDGLDPVEWGDEPVEAEKPANEEKPEEKPEPKKEAVVITKREGKVSDPPELLMKTVFMANMVTLFRKMENEIIKNLQNYGKTKAIEETASDAAFAGSAADIVSSVYDEAKWAGLIAIEAEPFIRGTMTNGLIDAMEEVAPTATVNASSPKVMAALDDRKGQIRSTATTVEKELRKDIKESINLGESRSQTIKRVRTNFDTRAKAERVVRTETIWAQNEGTVLAWEQSGVVTGKRWNAVGGKQGDGRTSEECKFLHGKTVSITGSFVEKGDTLDFIDSNGIERSILKDYETIKHPPQHPNCRCTLEPIIAE